MVNPCPLEITFTSKNEVIVYMEEIFIVIRLMQQKNQSFCEFIAHFQKFPSMNIIKVCCYNTTSNKKIMN